MVECMGSGTPKIEIAEIWVGKTGSVTLLGALRKGMPSLFLAIAGSLVVCYTAVFRSVA